MSEKNSNQVMMQLTFPGETPDIAIIKEREKLFKSVIVPLINSKDNRKFLVKNISNAHEIIKASGKFTAMPEPSIQPELLLMFFGALDGVGMQDIKNSSSISVLFYQTLKMLFPMMSVQYNGHIVSDNDKPQIVLLKRHLEKDIDREFMVTASCRTEFSLLGDALFLVALHRVLYEDLELFRLFSFYPDLYSRVRGSDHEYVRMGDLPEPFSSRNSDDKHHFQIGRFRLSDLDEGEQREKMALALREIFGVKDVSLVQGKTRVSLVKQIAQIESTVFIDSDDSGDLCVDQDDPAGMLTQSLESSESNELKKEPEGNDAEPDYSVNIPMQLFRLSLMEKSLMPSEGDPYNKRLREWVNNEKRDVEKISYRYATVATEWHMKQLDTLIERYPHIADLVTQHVRPAIIHSLMTSLPIRFPNLLLAGEPGIGKTWFAQKLGKLLKIPFRKMSFAGGSTDFMLTGSAAGFRDANPGMLLNFLVGEGQAKREHPTPVMNGILFLDEIDKVSRNEWNPLDCLYDLLEPENARQWHSPFLHEVSIDASHLNWMMAANRIESIPVPILSRCSIVEFPDPQRNPDHYARIIRGMLEDVKEEYAGILKDGIPVVTLSFSEDVPAILESMPLRDVYRVMKSAVNIAMDDTWKQQRSHGNIAGTQLFVRVMARHVEHLSISAKSRFGFTAGFAHGGSK